MASIVTRKNSFAVVYMTTVNGVRKQKWETYHTLPEAVRRKEQLELYHDLRKSKKIGGEVETVAQLMSVYLRLHGVPRWSPSTYRSNCGLIQHYILPCLGSMRLSELSPRIVAALYRQMLDEPRISTHYHKQGGELLSPNILRNIHKVLHSAFEQAVLWEYVERNPFHHVPLPPCRYKQKAFLTPKQIRQLMVHCFPTLALAVHLAFAASDFILMPSLFEPCGLPQMTCQYYGSLPVVHDTGGLHDTVDPLDIAKNTGNGFRFETYDDGGLLWAVGEAMHFYEQPAEVKENIISRVMRESRQRFNHDVTAQAYIKIYESMLARPLVQHSIS